MIQKGYPYILLAEKQKLYTNILYSGFELTDEEENELAVITLILDTKEPNEGASDSERTE